MEQQCHLGLANFNKDMLRHHIATHSLSSPITSETVPLKFPGNFQKFPKKLEALLLEKQLGKGNFLDSRKFPEPYYYSHHTIRKSSKMDGAKYIPNFAFK